MLKYFAANELEHPEEAGCSSKLENVDFKSGYFWSNNGAVRVTKSLIVASTGAFCR
jgi:hypothetical protein